MLDQRSDATFVRAECVASVDNAFDPAKALFVWYLSRVFSSTVNESSACALSYPAGTAHAARAFASSSRTWLNSTHVGSDDGCHNNRPTPASNTNGLAPTPVRSGRKRGGSSEIQRRPYLGTIFFSLTPPSGSGFET